jgi:glucose/arabinose dehydrogenase
MIRIPLAALLLAGFTACSGGSNSSGANSAYPHQDQGAVGCNYVTSGYGPTGTTPVHFVPVVTGLQVPWGMAFLPASSHGQDWLVTERPGTLRLVRNGALQSQPVATVANGESGEGGLLGIALHPQFAQNSYVYLFYTSPASNGTSGAVNRVQRFVLSADHTSATPDKVIIDNIPSGVDHNGGRIKFGPDGNLYIGTGDAIDAVLSQDPTKPNGKILRVTPDGAIPSDNPQPGNPWFVKGIRNLEAFDWLDSSNIIIADNGPTGEYENRYGGDRVAIVNNGNDLGWPTTWQCEAQSGLTTAIMSWVEPVPPGGGVLYTGNDIPAWKGSFIFGAMGAEHLHRVVLDPTNSVVASHEVYFQGDQPQGLGRIRDVEQGPNGELYVTTTNCDSRGSCPPEQDGIYRILPGATGSSVD